MTLNIQGLRDRLAKERAEMGKGGGGNAVLASENGPASLNIVAMLIDAIEVQANEIAELKKKANRPSRAN